MPVRRMSLKKWIVGNYERLSVEDRARYGDMVIVTANGTYSGKAVWGAEDMEKELAFKINAWVESYRDQIRQLPDLGDFDGFIELQDVTWKYPGGEEHIPYITFFMDQVIAVYTTEYPDQFDWKK
jgi:hypothetical protein